jgi:hypothetical protein
MQLTEPLLSGSSSCEILHKTITETTNDPEVQNKVDFETTLITNKIRRERNIFVIWIHF